MREIAALYPKFEAPIMSVAIVLIPDLHGSPVSKIRFWVSLMSGARTFFQISDLETHCLFHFAFTKFYNYTLSDNLPQNLPHKMSYTSD